MWEYKALEFHGQMLRVIFVNSFSLTSWDIFLKHDLILFIDEQNLRIMFEKISNIYHIYMLFLFLNKRSILFPYINSQVHFIKQFRSSSSSTMNLYFSYSFILRSCDKEQLINSYCLRWVYSNSKPWKKNILSIIHMKI
jgi:hypothetical protein